MSENNVKKLCNYMYSCVRESLKAVHFRDLNSCKDNKIIITDKKEFSGDNKEIITIMTSYALNKQTMTLLYGEKFIKGQQTGKNNNFYTPLYYSDATLTRQDDKIILSVDNEKSLNVGAIASLLKGEDEKIELMLDDLLEVQECDIETVMRGLGMLDMSGLEIVEQKAIILTKLPDATANLLTELKEIAEIYSNR